MNYTYDKQKILEVIKKDYEERCGFQLEDREVEIVIQEDGSIQFISDKIELERYIEGSEEPPFLSTSIESEMPQLIEWAILNKKFLLALYNRRSSFEPNKKMGYIFIPVKVEGLFISVELFAEIDIEANLTTYTEYASRERVLLMTRIAKLSIADLSNHEEGAI